MSERVALGFRRVREVRDASPCPWCFARLGQPCVERGKTLAGAVHAVRVDRERSLRNC